MPEYVCNVDGTSTRKCVCTVAPNTWRGHWTRGTGLPWPLKCSKSGCAQIAQYGAHVNHYGSDQKPTDNRVVWIVPFCPGCNKISSVYLIELKDKVVLCGAAKVDCA